MVQQWAEQPEMLTHCLNNHIVKAKLVGSDLRNEVMVNAISGEQLRVNTYGTDPEKVTTTYLAHSTLHLFT